MLDFLKRFGLGILYVLISPFVITFLLLWAIFDIGIYFIELLKAIKSFFKGKKMFHDFPEDIEAERILSLQPFENTQPIQTQTQVPPTNSQSNNGGTPTL